MIVEPLSALALLVGAGPALVPKAPVTTFVADVRDGEMLERVSWQAPERFASRALRADPILGQTLVVERDGTRIEGAVPGSPRTSFQGTVERRLYAARPDGYSLIQERFEELVEFVVGQARAGKLRLKSARAGGRAALQATVRLYPNDCAALRGGSATVWLDRATLLPLRLAVRRTNLRADTRAVIRSLNRPVPGSAFASPRLGARPNRLDYGFTRTSPAAAAQRLSYRPLLPRSLPAGFRLSVSGWAPRSGITGAEGSNPRYAQLFGAVYRRGFERIDVTQRLAGQRGWLNDPFGAECQFQFEERANVNGVRARFGTGPATTPHLYWRSGRLLFTVSGPFSKGELLAVAKSLAAVAP